MDISTVDRTGGSTSPQNTLPEPEPNKVGAEYDEDQIEPVESFESSGKDIVLSALGLDDDVRNLPDEAQDDLKETKQYVMDIIKKSGGQPTVGEFRKQLEKIKYDMGLSFDDSPDKILDRIGGVIKAWKQLTFVTDNADRKSIFYKLARAQTKEEQNKIVFQSMEKYSVWR